MDASSRPLSFSERLYWRVFVVLGTLGLAYETYVLGNRGVFTRDRSLDSQLRTRQQAQDDVADHRLLTDEQLRRREH